MPGTWQKILSFFYPVRIRKASSTLNPLLELFYYRGQYLLGTTDALYSDGDKYRPLVAAFNAAQFKPYLKSLNRVLVLGTGLASAVHILHKMGLHPAFTLVDLDQTILKWAREFLPAASTDSVEMIQSDAFCFVERPELRQYDLVIIDVFLGRVVPDAALEPAFIGRCRELLSPGGNVIFNYMVLEPYDEHKARLALETSFDTVTELRSGLNRVYIARD